MPIRTGGCSRAIRINHYKLRAIAPRFLNKWPQVNVVAVNVRSPGDDVLRLRKLLRLCAHIYAVNRLDARSASLSTDGARQLRSSKPMKEPAVHGTETELAESAPIGIWQNRFGAKFCRNAAKLRGNGVQGFVPGDASESARQLRLCGSDILVRPARCASRSLLGEECPSHTSSTSLGRDPLHRVQNPVRRVHAIQVLRDFRAKKPARHGMSRVALNFRRTPIFNGNQNSAGIGTVVGAGGVNNAFHNV